MALWRDRLLSGLQHCYESLLQMSCSSVLAAENERKPSPEPHHHRTLLSTWSAVGFSQERGAFSSCKGNSPLCVGSELDK